MKNSADVIVIGSGLGGLECAHILSRQGLHVLVLERQQQPGGCMQSYVRGGLRLDTGLHYVGALAEGQSLHAAFRDLGLLRLPWRRLDAEGFDVVHIADESFPFAEGFDAFAHILAQRFPHERVALQQYVDAMQQVDFVAGSNVNAYDYLCGLFHDPLLINVLGGTSLKQELRRETLPWFSFAHLNSGFIESSWRLCGDGGMLVQSLVSDIEQQGGEVCCGSAVIELVEHDGQLVAARCANGETYTARTFISDIHPQLLLPLVQNSIKIKETFRRRIRALQNTRGMFTASLVLKPNTVPYINHNLYLYDEPNVWTQSELDGTAVGGVMVSARVPEDGTAYVRQADLLTPMPWAWCQQWEATHMGHRGEGYTMMKRRMADECLALAEQVIPRLSTMVSERYTSTSLTYRDYTLTPNGSAYGVRKDYHNPMMTLLSAKTPIPNLLLTGQSLTLHGLLGVTMTSLFTVAEIIGKDEAWKITQTV